MFLSSLVLYSHYLSRRLLASANFHNFTTRNTPYALKHTKMFEKLRRDVETIDLEMKKLQRTFHFALNDYDFHHENDEKEILAKYNGKLDQIEMWCSKVKSDSDTFINLLEQAKERTTFYDKAIREIASKHEIDITHILDRGEARKELINPPPNETQSNDCKTPI